MPNKILVIAAHPDDEVLGVGGTVIKHVRNGEQVSILILGDGESSRNERRDIQKRETQAREAVKVLGASEIIFKRFPDNKFDSLPLLALVKEIEMVIERTKPNIIYTHHGGDINIDHQLTFQAMLTAVRPQPHCPVKKILTFETLSATEWQAKNQSKIFCPNEYNNITDFIDKKIKALNVYQDELREYPHPRSIEGVRILAQYRGMEVGYKFAEAFQLIRKLND